ncbi:MAG TPA: histidine phosphatase family protein [Candidatus Paceibacterota bacterium]|nr:histidine phosphatase family protein [Candidatus Paceibacterota bacterium]
MPKNLILVRHGQSEGNVASGLSHHGDHSAFTEAFKDRHGSTWRLSKKGREQALSAGKYLKQLGIVFDRHYVSEYLRAMETASLLDIPDAEWYVDFYLRERDWGEMEVMSIEEREKRYADTLRRRKASPFYWTPPNGQSMADLCLRVDRVIETLHRECAGRNVIIVCHGEVMSAFQVRLERMSQERFRELCLSRDPKVRINNCQIIHYTRADNPNQYADGNSLPHVAWVRSVCPWDEERSSDWRQISRQTYSNEALYERVEATQPMPDR